MVAAVPAQALGRIQEGAAQTVIVTRIRALFAHGGELHKYYSVRRREAICLVPRGVAHNNLMALFAALKEHS